MMLDPNRAGLDNFMMPELKPYADLAYSNCATIQNTFDLAVEAIKRDVPGDFVECGVAAGAQLGVMGLALYKFGERDHLGHLKRMIFGYDSYQGIPLAGRNDTEQPGIGPVDPNRVIPDDPRALLVSSGITAHSLNNVIGNICRWQLPLHMYNFVEGWFQDTLPGNTLGPIALLRLDGDLYESTKVCLEHLHPKVSKGGFVIIDDYALAGARKAVDEYFAKHGLNYKLWPVNPVAPEVHWYQIT